MTRLRRGSNPIYSDLAIVTVETLKSVYSLAGRQTEGLLHSLFELMQVDLSVPEHSTVLRVKCAVLNRMIQSAKPVTVWDAA